jgi:hypothetical protein
MDTISNIKDKINTYTHNPKIQTTMHVFLILLLMVSSFLLGKLSAQTDKIQESRALEIYLPNGELLTQTSAQAAQSQLSAYILGGATAAVIPENGPDISERLRETTAPSDLAEVKDIFASKNGSTYYTPGCASGNRVKIENRVYFDSESDAEDQGYTRSKLCK